MIGPGVSLLRNGELHLIDNQGFPGRAIDPWDIYKNVAELRGAYSSYDHPTCLVHGFKYDPSVLNGDNPHTKSYAPWTAHLGTPTFGFGWYSVPGGLGSGRSFLRYLRSIGEAWAHGKRTTYKHAWDIAAKTGPVLGVTLDALASQGHVSGAAGITWDIIGHSLGTRVTLFALLDYPQIPVRRVLFLNGAASCSQALVVARKMPEVEFINVIVRSDKVLKVFGRHFSGQGLGGKVIGYDGLGELAPPNWTEFQLDSLEVHLWATANGWDLRGNNPKQIADHWYTTTYEPNWRFWGHVLRGGKYKGIPTREA